MHPRCSIWDLPCDTDRWWGHTRKWTEKNNAERKAVTWAVMQTAKMRTQQGCTTDAITLASSSSSLFWDGAVPSCSAFIATGIFTFSPSGIHTPYTQPTFTNPTELSNVGRWSLCTIKWYISIVYIYTYYSIMANLITMEFETSFGHCLWTSSNCTIYMLSYNTNKLYIETITY